MKRKKREKEYEVEKIVGFNGELYTVKWKGYSKTTKEPIENLENCMDLVEEYHSECLKKSQHVPQTRRDVEYFGYNFGKGIIIFRNGKYRIARTFREALNTDAMAVANFLEEKVLRH